MPAAKLKPPPSDPLREALAAALEDWAAAKQQVENHKAATRKCWSAITAAQANAAKAEKGITTARVDAATVLADVAADDDDDMVPPPNTVSLAQAAHADALETIENLRAARERLRLSAPDIEQHGRNCEDAVDACISEILAPRAQRLLDRLRELIAEAQPLREMLFGLGEAHTDRAVSWRGRKPIETQLDEARVLASAHALTALTISDAPWAAARAALRADPDADIDDLLALPAGSPAPSAA